MTEDNGKQKKKMTAGRYMFGGLFRHPGAMIFALILTFVSTLLVILPMVIVGLALDELTVAGLSVAFMNLVWLIIIFGSIYMVMYFVVGYTWAVVTLRWERDSRQEFFESLQENSMTFHDQVDSKKLLS
ncbi:MAG: ABC transporter transmembrane domain-containing protein, partial [Candidatus Thorarchaeota archaeon]